MKRKEKPAEVAEPPYPNPNPNSKPKPNPNPNPNPNPKPGPSPSPSPTQVEVRRTADGRRIVRSDALAQWPTSPLAH